MLTGKKVAEYFLSLSDEDLGDMISNPKLQKLMYYVQGFSLVLYGKPFFREDIHSYTEGPIVLKIYGEYKQYGANGIAIPNVDLTKYTNDEKKLMNEVYTEYGQFAAWKLSKMTQSEDPWKNTNINDVKLPSLKARGSYVQKNIIYTSKEYMLNSYSIRILLTRVATNSLTIA